MNALKKNWTVLVYANANNDLEPETWQSVIEIQKSGQVEALNIAVQIGRADRQLIEIIRPLSPSMYQEDAWSGVRRYLYNSTELCKLQDLGNINMADPSTLFDFILWGYENYPAEHYLLILGGHAYQLVGMMPDYTQDQPYILGFPEMCRTFEEIYEITGKKIDLVILDTCYCNCVEVLYELGKSEDPPLKNMLTYVGKGPISGMPLNIILQEVQRCSNLNDINIFTRKLVDVLENDLVAIEINYSKLKSIKALFSHIAYCYLSNDQGISLTPARLITSKDVGYPWCKQLIDLHMLLQSLVLCGRKKPGNPSAYINIQLPNLKDSRQLQLYSKLAFARGNHWTNLLSSKPLDFDFGWDAETTMKPMLLSYEAVYSYISMMNPTSGYEKWHTILHSLKEYKGWN